MAVANSLTYKNCKTIINRGLRSETNERGYVYEDMLAKLDVFLIADRITLDEYTELKAIMDKDKEAEAQ